MHQIAWTSQTLACDLRDPTQPRGRRLVSLLHFTPTVRVNTSTSTAASVALSSDSDEYVVVDRDARPIVVRLFEQAVKHADAHWSNRQATSASAAGIALKVAPVNYACPQASFALTLCLRPPSCLDDGIRVLLLLRQYYQSQH